MVDKRLIKQVKQHKQRFLLLVGFAVSGGILAVLQPDYLANPQPIKSEINSTREFCGFFLCVFKKGFG